MEALFAYNPFWLRLGLEIVVGKAVPVAGGRPPHACRKRAELEAFAREHFLADADVALQRAGNKAIKGLHRAEYWVSNCNFLRYCLHSLTYEVSRQQCADSAANTIH